MPNLNGIMKKLQRAILSTDLIIKIGSSQFYSLDLFTPKDILLVDYADKQNKPA